jgi:signal transduction histidine kinase
MAWRSSAIRATATILLGFLLAAAAIFAAIAWQTTTFLKQRNAERILSEARLLSEIAARDGAQPLLAALRRRQAQRGDMLYGLSDAGERPVWLGGLQDWPPALMRDNATAQFSFAATPTDQAEAARGSITPRVAIGATVRLPDGERLLVARDVTNQNALMSMIRTWVFAGLATMAIAALIAGWLINRTLLSRLARMSETARGIMSGDLTQRMQVSAAGDEFDQLAEDLNTMLARIERLMAGLREVSDNIAHDLKTPLNRLRMRAENALRAPDGETACRAGLEGVLVEADELMRTFNALLQVARLEAVAHAENLESFDLSALIDDVAEFYDPVIEEAHARLVVDVAPGLEIRANRQLVSQALTNLLENSIKYGLDGAVTREITVGARAEGAAVALWVADRGAGIRGADRARVLRRFVRLDDARTKPGTGIGLSLAAAVAMVHGGEIKLGDNAPGLKVTIRLPADASPAPVLSGPEASVTPTDRAPIAVDERAASTITF